MLENKLPSKPEEPPPVINPPTKNQVFVIETIYHQPVSGFPTTALGDSTRFSRELESDEQPYERHKIAKHDWELLDHGWIDKCGMFLLRNDEGFFSTNPTPEQREEVFKRVIEISFDNKTPSILIPPKETCRFYPTDLSQIWLRCQEGTAKYSLYLIPR